MDLIVSLRPELTIKFIIAMNDLKIIQEKIYEIRAQLDAISMALAELQSKETVKKERRPIGFIQH